MLRKAKPFVEDLDIGCFNPFRDMKDSELVDEEKVVKADGSGDDELGWAVV